MANPLSKYSEYPKLLKIAIDLMLTKTDRVWVRATGHTGGDFKCMGYARVDGLPAVYILNELAREVANGYHDEDRVRFVDFWKMRYFFIDEYDGHHCSLWTFDGFVTVGQQCVEVANVMCHAMGLIA